MSAKGEKENDYMDLKNQARTEEVRIVDQSSGLEDSHEVNLVDTNPLEVPQAINESPHSS